MAAPDPAFHLIAVVESTLELPPAAATRLEGHLRLVCDAGADGRTRVRNQSFCAPIHLSKPHHDAGSLVLNIANPTAGFFEGDRVSVDISVECGARLLLTTPSANRVHKMRSGRAEMRQRFRVENGGSLDIWPELLIPHRAARYWQRTDIDLAQGGELLFFERLAPGRTAMGEVFAFAELRLSLDFSLDGRLLLRERYRLARGQPGLAGIVQAIPRRVLRDCVDIVATVESARRLLAGVARTARGEHVDRRQRTGRQFVPLETNRRR